MPLNERRNWAVNHFIRSLRTGEASAVEHAATFFGSEVVFRAGGEEFTGPDAVAARLLGQWALTPVFAQGEWSPAQEIPDGARVTAVFPHLGAAPTDYTLTFRFDNADRIAGVDETMTSASPAKLDAMPDDVRAAINGALANGTPMVVAYVGDDGAPSLSLRGSVQVHGPAELCIWARNAESGFIRAIRAKRPISLLYRNSAKRMTLTIRGQAEVIEDTLRRDEIYALSPEVEKRHDTARTGVAVLVRIERLGGTTPRGPILVVPERQPVSRAQGSAVEVTPP